MKLSGEKDNRIGAEMAILKKYFFAVILFLLTTANVFSQEKIEIKVGRSLPDFILNDLTGQSYVLKDFRNKKIVYLNFFATWCVNCKKEIPALNKLYLDYKDKGFIMFGIDVKEKTEKVAKFSKGYNIQYPVLLDTDALVAKAYCIKGFPISIIIDKEGIVRYIGSRPPADFEKFFKELGTKKK